MDKSVKAPSRSLKQRVYEDLKRRIISCEILPGALLTEESICEAMSASRTPVRDALGRLEQEHLVSIHPKKGILVNTVSLNNVNELFEARMRIEPYCVMQYGNRIRDDVFAECIAYFRDERHAGEALYRRDDEFHQMFVNASANRYLIMFYNTVKDQVMRYRVLSDQEDRTVHSQEEHCDIALHCLRGSWSEAAEAMRVHIENSKISIINYALSNNLNARNIFAPSGE